MSSQSIIVGLGELLWDILPDGKKLGGAPANFAFHASQLGYEAWAVSAVGHDANGEEILDRLSKLPMKHHIQRPPYPTGTVEVTMKGAIPSYKICEGVAWDHITWDETMEDLAKRTGCVVFGTLAQRNEISRESIRKFLRSMPQENTLRIFDINLRQNYYGAEIIEESLQLCNAFKINDEEVEILQKLIPDLPEDMLDCARYFVKKYELCYLILTCGKAGSYLFRAEDLENHSFIPTPDSPVVDTVGAGDSFTASLAAALLSGNCCLRTAHQFATDVATFVCSQKGAMPTLPEEFPQQIHK